jgi:hypothetical protein
MLADRFREYWKSAIPTPAPAFSAFVVCPLVQCMTPMQYAQMEYVYRLAYEQAQAQVAKPMSARLPAFSLN